MPDWVVYVDDTGFGKISLRGHIVLCFAGDGQLIQEWKDWWRQPTITIKYPRVEKDTGEKIALYAIDIKQNKVLFHQNLGCVHLDPVTQELQALFTGSGGTFALAGWQSSKCAKTSVSLAMDDDCRSGGTIRYVDFDSGLSDIEDSVHDIHDVELQLQKRGFAMNANDPNRTVYPIGAADISADVANVKAIVASDSGFLNAPVGNEGIVWDEPTKNRLHSFIENMISEEQSMS
ncbi:hypothetical protein [Pantoea vagans]|uniref:hypothetical protein n=1 Tax=Pantoea vagans TaxID=470934 RepID=UPI003FA375AB